MNYPNFEPEVDVLPNPADAARIINEKTLPVSLRINEKTQAFFDSEAAIYGISGNVMMSLLLDRYVDYQDNVAAKSEELNLVILRKHLERCTKIVKKADDITLLRNVLNEGDGLAAMNATPDEITDILRDYNLALAGNPQHHNLDLRVWTVDAEFHCIENDPDHPAYLDTDFANTMQTHYYDLYINPRKWPIVIYLAKAYESKIRQLFPGENETKTNNRINLGRQFYCELIEIINSANDRAELAQKIAAAYLAAQGVELVGSTNSASTKEVNDASKTKEIDFSELVFAEKSQGNRSTTVNNVGLIVQALEQLRGPQHFNRIVDVTQTLRLHKYPDLPIPEKFDSVVSNTLQTHSSDLRSYNGKDDYFAHPAPGYWMLRPGVHNDESGNVVCD